MKFFFACSLFIALACQPVVQNTETSQVRTVGVTEPDLPSSPSVEMPTSVPEEMKTSPTDEKVEEIVTAPSAKLEESKTESKPNPSPAMEKAKNTHKESETQPSEEIPQEKIEEVIQDPTLQTEPVKVEGISHATWNSLVSKYVTSAGKVNYKGFLAEKAKLQGYLDLLSANPPASSWSQKAQLAYWINAYNAFTVKLIIDNYPLKSIMDLGKPWDKSFITIGGKSYTLNQIEHETIRKQFNEPRIHFAVNCASVSCPKLLNEAYTEAKLDAQLTAQTKSYLNNPAENGLSSAQAELSSLFDWYKEDFTKSGTVIDFVNKYASTKVDAGATISYKEYNWSLNE